ncbi:hypothetical protein [Bifidobacterium sp. SO1]|uniref:hypothetical protein n=1 Tax=Bifidobacterium sp. SO1 TaxID=2809029 RepID=UPI001BDCBA2F|nr:hypothetical protein [Bifidobacterium sp. SO1]MBT1162756.1 hypothetical protein [Bifidobacterium sp. SO1]
MQNSLDGSFLRAGFPSQTPPSHFISYSGFIHTQIQPESATMNNRMRTRIRILLITGGFTASLVLGILIPELTPLLVAGGFTMLAILIDSICDSEPDEDKS